MRIDYLPLAAENIQDIKLHFLMKGGKMLALKMIQLIRADIALLSEHPHKAPSYALMPGVRRLVVANGLYLVFYRVTDAIEVLHVRRAERAPAVEDDLE